MTNIRYRVFFNDDYYVGDFKSLKEAKQAIVTDRLMDGHSMSIEIIEVPHVSALKQQIVKQMIGHLERLYPSWEVDKFFHEKIQNQLGDVFDCYIKSMSKNDPDFCYSYELETESDDE